MVCPKCKESYKGYPALSRRDNKTEICSICGQQEALLDIALSKIDPDLKRQILKEDSLWLKK